VEVAIERAAANEDGVTAVSSPPAFDALTRTILRGAGWAGSARLLTNAGTALRYVCFARLLGPFDFGVFGAAALAEGLLRTLTDPALGRALVPERGDIEPFLDTIWSTMLAQGLLVSTIMILAAKPLAAFFQIGSSYHIFFALAPVPSLISLQSPAANSRIERSLNFRATFALDLAEFAGGFAVGLTGILYFRDWRGLVLAVIGAQVTRTILSHCLLPYRPRLRLDWLRARHMFRFGRWVILRRIADYVAGNLDNMVVGHLLGASQLGEYQLAFRLGGFPCSEVSTTAALLTFPLVAHNREHRHVHWRVFAIASIAVLVVGVFFAFVVKFFGGQLLTLTVGPRWSAAAAPLRVLCWYGCARGLIVVGQRVLEGLCLPSYSFRVTLLSTLLLSLLIYPLTVASGITGAAWAATISVVLPVPVLFRLYRKAADRTR